MYFRKSIRLASCLFGLLVCGQVIAEVNENDWPKIRKEYFQNRSIQEVDFINITGPGLSENGSQVPIKISVDNNRSPKKINFLYVIVDSNPVKLASTYKLSDAVMNLKLETRVRMNSESYIRLVGEASDGQLFMTKTSVEAGGGCGGNIVFDETSRKNGAGDIRLNVSKISHGDNVNQVAFMIKHPMLSGLQHDKVTGILIPSYYVNQAIFSVNDDEILSVIFGVSTSENPYLRFSSTSLPTGVLKATAIDSEGAVFSKSVEYY